MYTYPEDAAKEIEELFIRREQLLHFESVVFKSTELPFNQRFNELNLEAIDELIKEKLKKIYKEVVL